MQVFVPYVSPLKVAECLDRRRLRKQILECRQILAAIDGAKGWGHHPVVEMYRPHRLWLETYCRTLTAWLDGDTLSARSCSERCLTIAPAFLTDEFCNQHKRRLFAKDAAHYAQFAPYGASDENWYVVDGETVRYVAGRRLAG